MAIDYPQLRSWRFEDRVDHYDVQRSILYALTLGYGSDPGDATHLRFVHEHNTLAVPTLLTTIGAPGAWMAHPETGIDWLQILHGEHRMRFHAPVPAAGSLRSRTRVSHVVDKGADKGALVVTTRDITDALTDAPIATIEHVAFCRADGGFGGGDNPPEPLPPLPDTPLHTTLTLPTSPRAALLYRLNGDLNPIHILPDMAARAGFDRPILHGLCTYGMAARALIQLFCPANPERLGQFSARFSAVFFPGDTLHIDTWKDGSSIRFRALDSQGNVVLSHGVATIK